MAELERLRNFATYDQLSVRLEQTERSRWWHPRTLLMISQVAICTVLLVCSGLFLRTLDSARSADTGMAHRNLVLIGFDSANRMDVITQRARDLPGIESAAITTTVPLSLAGVSGRIAAEDNLDRKDAGLDSDIYDVSPQFFETLGIRFMAGADFRPDDAGRDVVIINQAAAERLFPDGNAIGRRVQTNDRLPRRVVGVVATAKSRMMVETPRPCVYQPLQLLGTHSIMGLTLVARVRGDPGSFVPRLTAAMRDADHGLALFDIRTMEQHVQDALLLQRAGAFLFGLAGLVGLLIAGAGLYGLVSFLVSRQTKEIGIRMALGACPAQILAQVLSKGLQPTAVGWALGLAAAAMLSRGIANLLYGITPTDGPTYLGVTLFLLVTALAACIVPALRAANVAPTVSIRSD